jgi:bacillithiol biosynthesis deacetylase BshB1
MDLIAFSPHPDDAELGCGGILALAAADGLEVAVVDLSKGERSTRGNVSLRHRESEAAADILGVSQRIQLGLPDGSIGLEHSHRQAIIELICNLKPRLVLAPYWEDRHPDHAAASKLVREACFFSGVEKISGVEPHRPDQILYYFIHDFQHPSLVVDITPVWAQKLEAIDAYKSQFQHSPGQVETEISQPGFRRSLEARAIVMGAMIGADFGEGLATTGPIPAKGIADIPWTRSTISGNPEP